MKKLIFILLLSLYACSSHKNDTGEELASKPIVMKPVSYDSYSTYWKKVSDFEKKALTKTAYEYVKNTIYSKAKKENNAPQIVKSLLYMAKYSQVVEENSLAKTIDLFKKEIQTAQSPLKNILQNYLAQMYWQYYRQHRHLFASNVAGEYFDPKSDFQTWDMLHLFSEINRLFDASLSPEKLLRSFYIEDFKDIVSYESGAEKYYPSLYDLLLNEAMNFYQSEENALPQASYRFKIDNPAYFDKAENFVRLDFNAKDTLSLQRKALILYRDWIKMHLNDSQKDALANADLKRLEFVYNQSVLNNKDSLYLQSLNRFVDQYKESDVSALALFDVAQFYFNRGNRYAPGVNDEYRFDLKKAMQYCEQAIEAYPKSAGAARCHNLKTAILNKNLEIKLETQIPENTKQLIKIGFKNTTGFELSAYKIDYEDFITFKNKHWNKEEILNYILKQKNVFTQKETLPDTKDYQRHSTEKILPPLPNGQYLILATDNDQKYQVYNYAYLQSTDVALQKLNDEKEYRFTVNNRSNGKPVENYSLEIQKRTHRNFYEPYPVFVKKEGGEFSLPKPSRYETILIKVNYDNGKTAWFGDNIHATYGNYDSYKPVKKAFVFTDRNIYRPGQIVYFKSILLEQLQNKSKVLPYHKMEFFLRDANYKEISHLTLTTNEYGSVAGNFVLPQDVLTGNFTIEVKGKNFNERSRFKVENYKRPKFEVKFLPVEGTYKVNEQVRVKGEAVTYAGAKLSGAKVIYRVKRMVDLPRWWYWYRPQFRGNTQEIAHGESKLNEDGVFEIDFKAIPDPSLQPEDRPVFIYEVTAEVTDINGETHTAVTRVKAGYHSLLVNLDTPQKIIKERNTDSLEFKVTNLNGTDVPATLQLEIYKLSAPSRVLRERPWAEPDIQEISKKEFEKEFPHLPYDKKESDFHFWPLGKKYFSKAFNTSGSNGFVLKNITQWPLGKYLVVAKTTDKEGNEVEDKAYFDLDSFKETVVPDSLFFEAIYDKPSYLPGEKLKLKFSSALPDAYARILIEKNKKIIEEKWIRLKNTSKTVQVSVDEKDRGGFAVHYIFYACNTYRKKSISIKVPYPSKELQIETKSFRDKLIPGQKETWSFVVKGPKGDKAAAEVLASMYDASLDAFVPSVWNFNPIRWRYYSPAYSFSPVNSFGKQSIYMAYPGRAYFDQKTFYPPRFKWFGFQLGTNRNIYLRGAPVKALARNESGIMHKGEVHTEEVSMVSDEAPERKETDFFVSGEQESESVAAETQSISMRKNLQETAFFYPQLHTDKKGNVHFSFQVPDALTKWKLRLLAHDKQLNYGFNEWYAQTQKDLMIFPNMPRFVREGDKLIASVKITNLTDRLLKGKIKIDLQDALSGKNITTHYLKGNASQDFSLNPRGNTVVSWQMDIGDWSDAIQYGFTAKAGNFTDGEQNILPVLSNRMLVTETIPMWVRSGQEKTFVMEKLVKSHSNTLKNQALTLEITSNPAWYAIQALPYLMETKVENSEQIFSRYYANRLARHIIEQYPQIRRVFDRWKNTEAMLSALEKNSELKNIILEATPWVRDAESEAEQKKRIALLFDFNKMSYEMSQTQKKLAQMQMPSGGFVWYKGAPRADRYITQYIVNGSGHLKHLGLDISGLMPVIKKAVRFTDQGLLKDYENLLEAARLSGNKETYLKDYRPGFFVLYYLYGRSFYPEIIVSEELKKVQYYYRTQVQKYWVDYDYYSQALIALDANRNGQYSLAREVVQALDENSVDSPELGKYWKKKNTSWRGFHSDIERQALLIEAFQEIGAATEKIDEMRIWLLKHKQTHAWKNTKQTAEAIYAFLQSGTQWLPITGNVEVQIGNRKIDPAVLPELKTEAGTGYFKKKWNKKEIKPQMGKVKLSNKGKGIVWGALYWQYFEDLDKITHAKTQLAITKKLFIRRFTDYGEELIPVNAKNVIQTGDLVRVQIIIESDREMEYVHLKDMRASGFEPVSVLSGYKWKNGLGFYESVSDVATHFFMDRLPKGVFVFEYDLRANNAGDFSNGITTIQSMYAPEFSSHSKGMEVKIR